MPFEGAHQAGIVTPVQDRLLFASFDVVTDDRDDLVQMLEDWTRASRRMVKGEMIGTDNDNQDAPPDDTGEAVGLGPEVTHAHVRLRRVAVRPRRATRSASRHANRPRSRPMPLFARDEIRPDISEGDLAIQACANDPTVAFHAIRDLARIGRGVVALRWSQQGFGRTSVTDSKQTTPRNLMGFKDGTNNIVVEDTGALDDHVWVGPKDDPAWMRNGSYLVTRRIRMMLEIWDRSTLVRPGADHRAQQAGRRAAREHEGARHRDPHGQEGRRAGDPGRCAHPSRRAVREQGHPAAAPRASRSPTASTR